MGALEPVSCMYGDDVTLYVAVAGLIGFARMVPGDVFEVLIRHGHQKWRCRGRIGLTQQTWDSDAFHFKALVGDVFNIKVRAEPARILVLDVVSGRYDELVLTSAVTLFSRCDDRLVCVWSLV